MNNFYKINAPEVSATHVRETKQPLIDLSLQYPQLRVDTTRAYAQTYSQSISQVRATVAKKLLAAQAALPAGIYFKIIEGYRPLWVQEKIFNEQLEILAIQNPNWSEKKLFEEASVFVAPPKGVPPHSTGGAVDLTLMSANGEELDMGTRLNHQYTENCYTNAQGISEEAKNNRALLSKVLEGENFVNYPAEWWHWSYGDQYWAFVSKQPCALYGSLKEA